MKMANKKAYKRTIGGQTKGKQRATNKNDKNDKNEKKIRNNIYIPEKQKINFAEYVSMTNEEYNKLLNEFGKDFTDKCIETLDNYKGANGKKYKDDYRAIRNWVIDKVKKQKPNETKQQEWLERWLEND